MFKNDLCIYKNIINIVIRSHIVSCRVVAQIYQSTQISIHFIIQKDHRWVCVNIEKDAAAASVGARIIIISIIMIIACEDHTYATHYALQLCEHISFIHSHILFYIRKSKMLSRQSRRRRRLLLLLAIPYYHFCYSSAVDLCYDDDAYAAFYLYSHAVAVVVRRWRCCPMTLMFRPPTKTTNVPTRRGHYK